MTYLFKLACRDGMGNITCLNSQNQKGHIHISSSCVTQTLCS